MITIFVCHVCGVWGFRPFQSARVCDINEIVCISCAEWAAANIYPITVNGVIRNA